MENQTQSCVDSQAECSRPDPSSGDLSRRLRQKAFPSRFFIAVIAIYLLLRLLLCAIIPLMDPSEARYAQICKMMAETGNNLEPCFIYEGKMTVFEGKPPLAFQMGAVSCQLFGFNEFAVRFPAFLSSLLILAMTCYTAKKLRNERTAIFAALFCLSTIVFYLYAGLCMTDMVLAAAIIGMIDSYLLFASESPCGKKRFTSLGLFVFAGLGMIAKGPVALVMAGLPLFFFLLWNRRWREWRQVAWFRGFLIFAAIAVPWYAMMAQKHPDFLEYFFINDNFKRFLFEDYGDKFGSGRETFRGMAVIWFLLANMPNFFLILLTGRRTKGKPFFSKEILADPLTGVTLLACISITLFWSLTSRVLITYLLPTIPCFCLFLSTRLNDQGWYEQRGFLAYLRYSSIIFAPVLAAGFLVACWLGTQYSTELAKPVYRRIQTMRTHHPEIRTCPLYFLRSTPFSANFYCPEWVVNHGPENKAESLARSRNAILLVREKDRRLDPVDIARPLLFQYGKWFVYGPEEQAIPCPPDNDNTNQIPLPPEKTS